MELLPLSGLLPRATGLHPDVVAVPPVEQQVGIGAEAGRIARGKEDIVGLAAVDGSVGGRRGIGLDGHLEAESVEVVLDLGGHALNLLVVGGAQGDGTRGDAGLLDELLSLLGIGLVHRGSLMIVGEALGQVAAGSGGKAGEGVGDHLLGVERVHDGLTDLDVVPRLLGDVEHDEAGAETLNVIDLAAGALELVDGISGNELHNERGALLLSGNASGGVGQDAVLDLLILGSILTVVLGVGNQGDLGIGDRVVHPGAGADRLLGAILLGLGGRGNADDGQTILEQGEVGNLSLDRHGAGVLSLDGLEGLEERSIGSGSGASGVGSDDVVSSDLGTIGELGTLADGDLESGVVHRLGIVGGELVEGAVVVVIDAVKALDDMPVSAQANSGAGAGGVEAGRSVSGTSGNHAAATVSGIGGAGSGTLVAGAATAAGETKAGDSSDAAGEAEERTPGHTLVDDGHVFSYQ